MPTPRAPSRPLLLPQNRKIRHLQGIYIRNLSLTPTTSSTFSTANTHHKSLSRHSIDDSVLPSPLSPIRDTANTETEDGGHGEGEGEDRVGEERGLQHAHSTSDLRPPRPRRRSTNWVGKTPDWRQRRLEGVVERGMVDTFFSLHVLGSDAENGHENGERDGRREKDAPVYVSEVVPRAMNPTFRLFDLEGCGPGVTRGDVIVVRVWVRREVLREFDANGSAGKEEFKLLVEEVVRLEKLRFLEGGLEGGVREGWGKNCILVQLVDGVYMMETDFDLSRKMERAGERNRSRMRGGEVVETSSFNALMRLGNLDESIQDALKTREELAGQINAILKDQKIDESPQKEEDVALATRYIASERKQLKASIRRRAELKASIEARSHAIKSGNAIQAKVLEDITNAQEKLSQCRSLLTTATTEIHQQRRRICEELIQIFPIEPTNHPLLFTICGLPLPNSTFDDHDEDLISAALGYVARLVDMLQYYLSVPLTYPLSPYNSRTTIHDLISILQDNQRTFPLYMKGTVRFRFDYAVFLLNKDIECLAESQGLKVMDIRQTLPNLKYLLYVCSAGVGEVPGRKMGGVRGLLTGRGMELRGSSVDRSRRGSADSGVNGQGELVRRALEAGHGGVIGNRGREERKLDLDGVVERGGEDMLPFGGVHVKSLRTSGLRENVR